MAGALILLRDVSEEVDLARAMTEFAATVAHELRTPLTSLKGSIGLILGGAAGDVERTTGFIPCSASPPAAVIA